MAITAWADRYPCRALGDVSGIEWSTIWGDGPSGCHEASWRIDMDPNEHHPEFTRGKPVALKTSAHPFWTGYVAGVERDSDGWLIKALGYASMAATDFLALNSSGMPTSVPRDAVLAAIDRGLPWTVPVFGWPASTYDSVADIDTAKVNTLAQLLTAYAQANGVHWTVRADGILRFEPDPTDPRWITRPGVGIMGVADDDYITHLRLRYVSAVDPGPPVRPTQFSVTPPTEAANEVAAARWGRRERHVDRTGLGYMTAAEAEGLARSLFARVQPRLGWADPLTLDLTEITDTTNLMADRTEIQAGHRARIHGVYDIRGALTAGPSVEVDLAEVKASAEGDSIYLAPVGLVARDMEAILADVPYDPEEGFVA